MLCPTRSRRPCTTCKTSRRKPRDRVLLSIWVEACATSEGSRSSAVVCPDLPYTCPIIWLCRNVGMLGLHAERTLCTFLRQHKIVDKPALQMSMIGKVSRDLGAVRKSPGSCCRGCIINIGRRWCIAAYDFFPSHRPTRITASLSFGKRARLVPASEGVCLDSNDPARRNGQ